MLTSKKPRYHYVVTLSNGEEQNTFAASEDEAIRNVTNDMLHEWRLGATARWASDQPARRGTPNIR